MRQVVTIGLPSNAYDRSSSVLRHFHWLLWTVFFTHYLRQGGHVLLGVYLSVS